MNSCPRIQFPLHLQAQNSKVCSLLPLLFDTLKGNVLPSPRWQLNKRDKQSIVRRFSFQTIGTWRRYLVSSCFLWLSASFVIQKKKKKPARCSQIRKTVAAKCLFSWFILLIPLFEVVIFSVQFSESDVVCRPILVLRWLTDFQWGCLCKSKRIFLWNVTASTLLLFCIS